VGVDVHHGRTLPSCGCIHGGAAELGASARTHGRLRRAAWLGKTSMSAALALAFWAARLDFAGTWFGMRTLGA
jgi:hypothetical protein